MKNWEKVNEVWDEIPGGDEGTDHWRQICHAFNVDPDAEYVEPAKPQPEAEYDAGWVGEYWLTHTVQQTAAEAARRERETWADERAELEQHRADLKAAAGELLMPVPEPGSNLAQCISANRILMAERDELLWRNANQKRLLEQYQARLRERQPSADLAELVRLAESVDTIVNERRYIDPLFVDQSRLILRLAQAVAGMGGGK